MRQGFTKKKKEKKHVWHSIILHLMSLDGWLGAGMVTASETSLSVLRQKKGGRSPLLMCLLRMFSKRKTSRGKSLLRNGSWGENYENEEVGWRVFELHKM